MTSHIRRTLTGLALTLVFCGGISAQIVDEAYPVEPEDGGTAGTRPRFRVGLDGDELEDVRFRIVLSQDDFETETYVFDQAEERNGWMIDMFADRYGSIFRPPRPLKDGTYDWRVDAWNGIDWVEGDSIYQVHIDGTLPADVERVRMGLNEDGTVRLRWDPVNYDEKGEPEYISKYHVYSSERRGMFVMIRINELGTVKYSEFVDESAPESGKLVFYRIVAEDEAGNHKTGKYDPSYPPLPADQQVAMDEWMERMQAKQKEYEDLKPKDK